MKLAFGTTTRLEKTSIVIGISYSAKKNRGMERLAPYTLVKMFIRCIFGPVQLHGIDGSKPTRSVGLCDFCFLAPHNTPLD